MMTTTYIFYFDNRLSNREHHLNWIGTIDAVGQLLEERLREP